MSNSLYDQGIRYLLLEGRFPNGTLVEAAEDMDAALQHINAMERKYHPNPRQAKLYTHVDSVSENTSPGNHVFYLRTDVFAWTISSKALLSDSRPEMQAEKRKRRARYYV